MEENQKQAQALDPEALLIIEANTRALRDHTEVLAQFMNQMPLLAYLDSNEKALKLAQEQEESIAAAVTEFSKKGKPWKQK